jgi:hypothetical protein
MIKYLKIFLCLPFNDSTKKEVQKQQKNCDVFAVAFFAVFSRKKCEKNRFGFYEQSYYFVIKFLHYLYIC